ncbi:MAG: cell wall metabolism sensor histidine kinase WalK [Clostridiales bacterium]|nr:cell wall metabolism sensor histidine kinase WalK [Clostridiales bacterium]
MRSVFFRRVFLVSMVVILLAMLALVASYAYFGRSAYIDLQMDSLQSAHRSAQQMYEQKERVLVDKVSFSEMLGFLADTADADYLYVFLRGNLVQPPFNHASVVIDDRLQAEILTLFEGNSFRIDNLRLENGEFAIGYGGPLRNMFGIVDGGVIFVKEMSRIGRVFRELNNVLWLMTILVVPLFFGLAYLGLRQISKPIRQMTQVAIALSKGNYSVEANENFRGEMGIFARAMNRLRRALAATISQLNSEKNQLWSILASFSQGVAAMDMDGKLTHYNQALLKQFGAVEVNAPLDLVPDDAVWQAFYATLDTKEPHTLHYTLPGERNLLIHIVPVLNDTGECSGAVGLFNDITEMEQMEKMRRDYVANVSHELRTPLTAVRGLLEPLADGMIRDETARKRYYDIMLREVERLSRLITDLLQLSRLQAGTEELQLRKVDISELLGEIYQSYKGPAALAGRKLCLDCPALPPVLSDADSVEQLLIIFLDNALRYSDEGGEITLSAREDALNIYASVSNTGEGIAPGDLPHIFERFYRADSARSSGGTGLGLSIAKLIAESLRENIEVQSGPGNLTTFTLSLKKYVSNAIALGPAYALEKPADLVFVEDTEGSDSDTADYEVIE